MKFPILFFGPLAAVLFIPFYSTAASDSTQHKPLLTFSAFIDVFYAYDFNEPVTGYRLPFLYNHNRHNEFNLNFGFLKASIKAERYRANLALQAGTYALDNYAAEPSVLQHVYEGNAGISLNKKQNLWFDTGIFGSHIGFESAISSDNLTLSRSLVAENSPYYLCGAKISYAPNENWELTALLCNGWQRIKRVSGNSLPGFCSQVKYTHSDNFIVNWSTFTGTDDPDSSRRIRIYNHVYTQVIFSHKFGFFAGFDVGLQQRAKNSSVYNLWYCPVFVSQYRLSQQWAAAFRAEYFDDESGVIIPTGTPHGFCTTGLSLNLDYAPQPGALFRVEGRWLNSRDAIFERNTSWVNSNFCLMTSLAVSF